METGTLSTRAAALSRLAFQLSLLLGLTASLHAQIDPEKRQLIQLGYNQPLQGAAPLAAYGFYYRNQPNFLDHTNLVLRLAVAPVYLDTELGVKEILGPNTDMGFGLSGGGFASSYFEIRQGKYLKGESFDGHSGELSTSLYHLFNPDAQVPLNGVARASARAHFYDETDKTAAAFKAPDDYESLTFRTGLRYGGREPSMTTPLAMELSVWYEGHFRTDSGKYGFNNDREVVSHTHLFWTRAMLKYTLPDSGQYFDASLTAGVSANPDRFSAYRLGGYLPLISEFPLNIPGYFYQELSAERFALLNGLYSFPFDAKKTWSGEVFGAAGVVDYLSPLTQPGIFHSGVGAGVTYTSPRGSWYVSLIYGHGFKSIRSDGRGSDQVGLVFQYDFEATKVARRFRPEVNPYGSRGTERIFR
jgi:hypothetical protein